MDADIDRISGSGSDYPPDENQYRGLFSVRDRWGNSIAVWGAACLLFFLPLMCTELPGIRMENSVSEWLPANDPQIRMLRWFDREFHSPESVVISWDSSHSGDERAERLAAELQKQVTAGDTGIVAVTTPQQVLDRMRKGRVSEEAAGDSITGVLKGDRPDSPVAVIVDVDESQAAPADIINRIRSTALQTGIVASEIHLAGGLVTRVSLDEGVRTMQWNPDASWWQWHRLSPNGLSVVASAGLAWYLLRSLRLAVLVLFVSVYTAALTTTLIPLSGGTLNMVLVVIPTLLIVLTLSGAIHLVNYWRHAYTGDATIAASRAYETAAGPCVLAVATTAIGMLSLMTSDLKPVRDFGLFSAIGVLLSLGLILFGLPSLLILCPHSEVRIAAGQNKRWRKLGTFLTLHHKSVTAAFVVGSVVASCGLLWVRTETKLIRFFDPQSQIAKDYEFIERNICHLVPVEVALVFAPGTCESTSVMDRRNLVCSVQSDLKKSTDISGTLSLADFVAPVSPHDAESPKLAKARYNRTVSTVERMIRRQDSSASEFVRKIKQPFESDGENDMPAIACDSEIWRIRTFASALTEKDYRLLIAEIQEIGRNVLRSHQGVQMVVTGNAPLFLRTQEAVLQSMINSFGMAFVLIQIILFIQLRGMQAGALAMVPNVLPVTCVFGLVAWFGLRIDIGSMVTASVALGIAVDGTVHLLNWFEKGIRDGLTRSESAVSSLAHCGPSMMYTTIIICSGLLMLVGADLLLISRFGWLMAALVFAALLGDIILLPSMLQGRLGAVIETRIRPSIRTQTILPSAQCAADRVDAAHLSSGSTPGRKSLTRIVAHDLTEDSPLH